MIIQLRNIVQAEDVLGRLFQARPPKAKDTFRLAQLKRALVPAFEDYYEARTEVLKQHASANEEVDGRFEFVKTDAEGNFLLDEEGNKVRDDKAIQAFEEALEELLDEEIEVAVKPLTLSIVDSIALDPALSVDEMEAIFWLIKEQA